MDRNVASISLSGFSTRIPPSIWIPNITEIIMDDTTPVIAVFTAKLANLKKLYFASSSYILSMLNIDFVILGDTFMKINKINIAAHTDTESFNNIVNI